MVEIPDEYGLSSDSLRGSVMHIRPDLVGADPNQRRDPYTGQGLTREPLSMNERVALRTIGTYVDQDGNREEPPPIERRPVDYAYPQTATIPAATGGISPGVLFPPSVDEQLTAEEWEQREANEPHRMTRAEWLAEKQRAPGAVEPMSGDVFHQPSQGETRPTAPPVAESIPPAIQEPKPTNTPPPFGTPPEPEAPATPPTPAPVTPPTVASDD
jgi:hypothetical protein